MKLLRKILVNILGLRGYLRLVSKSYIRMISWGWMKEKYAELHFIKKLVNDGDTVLDIGANLAYYSTLMAKCAGKNGQLIAVEPIPLFAEVWKKNMGGLSSLNPILENCALGDVAKESVKMSIPIVNGVVRHGLTKVVEEGDTDETVMSFDVPMRVGDELISSNNIETLDFIKCDVEGYEQFVMPSLDKTLNKLKPMIQIELSGDENRKNVAEYLVKLGYQIFILKGELLHSIQKSDIFSVNQDFYFIHSDKMESRSKLIHK